jgi:hypothetical protein
MLNCALPDVPVVAAGLPSHFVILPAMPPQIPSMATFTVCESSALKHAVSVEIERKGRRGAHVAEVHLTFDTAVRRGVMGAARADTTSVQTAKKEVNCIVVEGWTGEKTAVCVGQEENERKNRRRRRTEVKE